ncbi:MAG TPA: serine hydrolase domain-containing protein [Pyrinomonadaceae bacterium]|nr:serine hydrolase domain-containing protein [Pyrinomonadaceae bacterium]
MRLEQACLKFFVFIIMLSLSCGAEVAAQPPSGASDQSARVDKLFAEWNRADTPGYVVAVVRDGRIIHARGYGMADLERDVKLSPASVFDIGSTAKQFTAASILLLAQQGKLSLDDDVRKYLPEMRKYEAPVTIRHLLHHTSGVRDYLTLMRLADLSPLNDYPDEQVIELIARQEALNFKPGDEHLYSNSGYFLLGTIIKRASGKSLRAFADEHIFRPLGMKNTHFHDDTTEIVKNRAIGYAPEGAGLRLGMSIFHVVGDGALMTTVEDLALWDANFYDNKLGGGADFVKAMLTTGKLNSGESLPYAAGLVVGDYKGLPMVSHSGAWAGYRADMIRFPEQKLSVICLSNFGGANPTLMAQRVAEIYLGEQLKTPAATANGSAPQKTLAPNFVKLSPQELADKAGFYYDERAGSYRRVELRDGKLFYVRGIGNESELAPLAADRFRMLNVPAEVDVTFKPAAAGEPRRMEVVTNAGPPTVFRSVEAATPTVAQLAEYAGEYYSAELGATHRVVVKDGQLMLRIGYDPEGAVVEPTVKDEFRAGFLTLKFKRNAQNQVEAMMVGAGRVKNIAFVKRRAS